MIMKPVALAAEDREFLRLVERSAFGNPFSREREGLEREIIFSPFIVLFNLLMP
jgi:hypothetical protein